MHLPKIPTMIDEQKRLEIVYQYDILDTEAEAEFDNITHLASTLCNTPISIISIIDKERQWYKSKIGLDFNEIPREKSMCSLAIKRTEGTIVIEKVMEDEDFKKIALVNGFVDEGFYAGVPIKDKDSGAILGTLCVIDRLNNSLSEKQIKSLEILAEQTSKLFELRRKNFTLTQNNENLNFKYSELEKFAGVISHDMKSPLNNIISIVDLIKENSVDALEDENSEYLNLIEKCSIRLKNYVDGVLSYYKIDNTDLTQKEAFNISEIIEQIRIVFIHNANISIHYSSPYETLITNKYGFIQVLMNLVENGIKYNDKEHININIEFSETNTEFMVSVSDNGIGIKSEHLDDIFETFKNLNVKDKYGNYGTGLGLSSVKKIIERIEGRIIVTSTLNIGTSFTIRLKK